jgi:hypothetical protein
MLQIDTGCIVAFDEGVDYDIQLVGGIRTALFGGEGLFLATLRGPGRVIVQSMTLQKMRRELAPIAPEAMSTKAWMCSRASSIATSEALDNVAEANARQFACR